MRPSLHSLRPAAALVAAKARLHRTRELVKSLVVCGAIALASVGVALADRAAPLQRTDDVALTNPADSPPVVRPASFRGWPDERLFRWKSRRH